MYPVCPPCRALLVAAVVMSVGLAFAHAEPVPDDTVPTEPGTHHLYYEHEYDGEYVDRPYGLHLPEDIEKVREDGRKLPMIVFLCGRGSRGVTEDKLYREGPIGALKRSKGFAGTVDYMVLAPQVPANERWETDRMGSYIAEATRRVIERYPVDPQRVYLVGMSMGGEGVWHAAMAGPELFATITSVGGRQHPQPERVAETLKDRTILIVVGSGDRDFTTGSEAMAEAFDAVDADLTHVVIPGRAHDIWGFYMHRPAFYQWMLKHRLGQGPPEDRETRDEILDWAMNMPGDPKYNEFAERIEKQFKQWKPHWHIDNCGIAEGLGVRKQYLGRENVFVTHPLNRQIPCRLMITAKVPADRKTVLHLEVGHDARQDWRLVVNVESHRRLQKDIGDRKEAKEPGWEHHTVNLTRHAGEEVFIEILNHARGWDNERAAWSRLEIVSTDK